jgi:hypothetical protein
MQVRWYTICLFSFLLAAAGCRSRRIEGVVTDDKGQPVSKAIVSLLKVQGTGTADQKPVYSTTDDEGRYSFPAPKESAFSVVILRPGYEIETGKINGDTHNPVNFTLQPILTYKVGDRVRILDAGWCPGTIVEPASGVEKDQYKVALDRQPQMQVEVSTERLRIRPLGNESPASPLPCSYFKKPGAS